jgi:hypothetical protein
MLVAKKRTQSHNPGARKPARKRKTTIKKRATAISLHIGLNGVNPDAYSGWAGPLAACEFDARDMAGIAKAQGMTPTVILTRDATRAKTLAGIRAAAKQLKSGDLFFLSYSGHGGQVDDVSGEEIDKLDETWCLYDGELIDDELYLEFSRFAKGVRVLVMSDSCHSGTVTRAKPSITDTPSQRPKLMPPDIAKKVYTDHKDPDTALGHVTVSSRLTKLAAKCKVAVILISGCQDNQTSMDGDHNGAFTEQLLKVWNAGAFAGNYAQFSAKIKAHMPPTQSPNLFQLGPTAAFARGRPFTV